MKRLALFLICMTVVAVSTGQQNSVTIELLNGDKVTGELLGEDENGVLIKTQFGELDIPRQDILSITHPQDAVVSREPEMAESIPTLNQEARWRTIWSAMGIGNSLYGFGLPFVLEIDDQRVANGMRLLMFGEGFYASWRYTQNMDLPLGRWQFQMTGAQLGAASLLLLMATVGFENWVEFDEDGKIALTYVMAAVPVGVWQADRAYRNWDLSDGQASVISSSVGLGAFNTLGAIGLLHSDHWEWTENLTRLYTILTYSGSLAGGWLAKEYVWDRSYTEDDAVFLGLSTVVGVIDALLLTQFLNIDQRKPVTFLLMAGANGFWYWADRVNRNVDLKRGDGRIIGLGAFAAHLTWLGIGTILNFDFDTSFARVMDMATITSGWYFTYRWVSTKQERLHGGIDSGRRRISLAPTLMFNGESFMPGLRLKAVLLTDHR